MKTFKVYEIEVKGTMTITIPITRVVEVAEEDRQDPKSAEDWAREYVYREAEFESEDLRGFMGEGEVDDIGWSRILRVTEHEVED